MFNFSAPRHPERRAEVHHQQPPQGQKVSTTSLLFSPIFGHISCTELDFKGNKGQLITKHFQVEKLNKKAKYYQQYNVNFTKYNTYIH